MEKDNNKKAPAKKDPEHKPNNKTSATGNPLSDEIDVAPSTEDKPKKLAKFRSAVARNSFKEEANKSTYVDLHGNIQQAKKKRYNHRHYLRPVEHYYNSDNNSSGEIYRTDPRKEPGKDPYKVVTSKNDKSEDSVTYHPTAIKARNHIKKVTGWKPLSMDEEVEQTNEAVLTLSQRIKRAQIMRREAPKIERAREISRTRFAREDQLKNRAEVLARRLVKKKFAGQRGYDYQKLSTSEKMAIDAMVDKKVDLIHRLAKRLFPVVKRKEVARMLALHQGVNTTPGASPVNIVNSYDPLQEMPEKYKTGVKSTDAARAAHFAKQTKMSPEQAVPAPGDATAKTKLSKYTKKYKQMFGESDGPVVWSKGNISIEKNGNKFALYNGKKKTQEFSSLDQAKKIAQPLTEQIAGLKKKAEKSGISYGTLKKVYDRGMAAWRTGHRPGTTPQQWAFARVNSFITKGKTYHTADKDLREEVELNEWYIDTANKYKPSRGDSIVTNNGGRVFGRVERVDEVSVYFRSQSDQRVYKTEINNVSKVDHWDGTLNENHSPECSDYVPPKKTLLKRIKNIKEAQREAGYKEIPVKVKGKIVFRKYRPETDVDKEEGEE